VGNTLCSLASGARNNYYTAVDKGGVHDKVTVSFLQQFSTDSGHVDWC